MGKMTDWIDNGGTVYVHCTRAEALAITADPRPGLRPRSRWTRDENEFAVEHGIGQWTDENCPACGRRFARRISGRIVGCPKCEPGTLETRGLERKPK